MENGVPLKRTRSSTKAAAAASSTTSDAAHSNGAIKPTKKARTSAKKAVEKGNPKAPFSTISIGSSAIPIHKVSVLGSESVSLGFGLTAHIAAETLRLAPASSYILCSDTNVAPLHLDGLKDAFVYEIAAVGKQSRVLTYVVPPGESVKTREMKSVIEDFLLGNKCTRDSCIVALGGGVIGDMFGFVAATFMRGIPVIQIPTTLLAMVDSSIGGKTAVDTPHGKNLVGAFHQPRHIFMDLAYLRTLPRREYVNGLAEVIKTAAFWDEHDFTLLENHAEDVLNLSAKGGKSEEELDIDLLVKIILGSVRVKAHVVTVDEKETGLRGLLNFGHTIGHAIEAILSPQLLHGECVSMGMVREAEIARHLGYINDVVIGRLVRCLQAYGLPVSTEDKKVKDLAPGKHCSVDQLLDFMKVDKKNQGTKKRIVMLSAIGNTVEPNASFIDDDVIRKIISPAMEVDATISPEILKKEIRLNVPGSKSISNRALILAALGTGVCRLEGLLHSDDVQVMLDSLQKLVGIKYTWEDNGDTLVVTGGAGKLQVPSSEIYLGNAGTAARFLTTVCCLVQSNAGKNTIVTGNSRMKQRPIGPLIEALKSNGCSLEYMESNGCLPLNIAPTGLKGGQIKLSASISSQYVSSILLSAPYSSNPVTLELIGDAVVSKPYIDMTIAMMKSFGISVTVDPENENIYHIPQGVYNNPKIYLVEADASSATYPLAFAAITGAKVTVTNIGRNSLQGDSEFAVKVLEPMGCMVEQTETETTVKGPKRLKPISSIDMESMTDAFLTASVLAAVASNNETGPEANSTKICGIANQRVKECNRIAAMVEQLAKFGVHASELPDGIQVFGVQGDPKASLKTPKGGVFCYDDHRVAMSFSLLACARGSGQKSVILEKKCVEKTWPAWWDTLENTLGVKLVGMDMVPDAHGSDSAKNDVMEGIEHNFFEKEDLNSTTTVLIGMRGVGKSHMGKSVAQALGRKFIDTDEYFVENFGKPITAFVAENSWEAFRKLEATQLKELLKLYPSGYVISCGGGIVETTEGRAALREWCNQGRVVHLTRDIHAVLEYLNSDKTRANLGEDPKSIWNRRKPLYAESCNAEFTIISDGSDSGWKAAECDFARFLKFSLSKQGTFTIATASATDQSFFLCLTFPNVNDFVKEINTAIEGTDALELRVDLLKEYSPEFIGSQISILRRHTSLPIIFTVRTKAQGGRFPDEDFENMFALLEVGLKHQVEFLDVEVVDSKNADFQRLYTRLAKNKGRTHFIASFHDFSGTAVWDQNVYGSGLSSSTGKCVMMRDKYLELHQFGDSIKLIGKANTLDDNFAVYRFIHSTVPTLGLKPEKPLIALNMGTVGQTSRVLNKYLTPVTHPSFPIAAAPGQLTIKQIHETLTLLGLVPNNKKFFLFGYPIAHSVSPTLHNTGFESLGLPYRYSLCENPNWSHVKAVLDETVKSGTFGGASVTIPHKESIIQHSLVSKLTNAAQRIGAVNTILNQDGHLVGENTDWLGIRASILKRVGGSVAGYQVIGGVIGAGGTARAACFALQSLGVTELRIWNRSSPRAKAVAQDFGANVVESVEMLFENGCGSGGSGSGKQLFLLVSSVPGNVQSELNIEELFSRANASANDESMGVFVDMAYKPRKTRMIEYIGAVERTRISWRCVEGVEVLIEQGIEQFERWTGRRAPRQRMEDAVYAATVHL